MPPSGHSPDRAVARRAGRQHGLVTYRQLIDAGLTREAIRTRVRRGQLYRVHHGVYVVGHDQLTPEGRWMAGVLAGGDGAVLSHESAAALWGIGRALISPVHVITAMQRRPRPGFKPHRSATLTADDIAVWRAIPVTTPERTIHDLPRHLRDQARIKAQVLRLLDRTGADGLHPAMTRSGAERRFLKLCRDLGIPRPRVNHDVEGRERDFVWPQHRLVVEVDGPHHDDPAQRAVDRARDREVTVAGWRVLRGGDDELEATAYDVQRSISSMR